MLQWLLPRHMPSTIAVAFGQLPSGVHLGQLMHGWHFLGAEPPEHRSGWCKPELQFDMLGRTSGDAEPKLAYITELTFASAWLQPTHMRTFTFLLRYHCGLTAADIWRSGAGGNGPTGSVSVVQD